MTDTGIYATAPRAAEERLRYGEACLKQGMGYQAAASAAGVCVADLMDFAPGYAPVNRDAPNATVAAAFAKCASALAVASPEDVRRVAALALRLIVETSGPQAARTVYDNVATATIAQARGSTPRGQIMAMIDAVAARHGITRAEIMGRSHEYRFSHPRQEAYWTLRENTPLSYPAIGRLFGRDHTTIVHGARAHEKRMAAK